MRTPIFAALAAAWVAAALAQAPKPPALPPINPNVAKLEQTSAALDSPAVGVAVLPESKLLLAAGEGGTLYLWPGGAAGVRVTDSKGQALKGHEAPLTALSVGGTLAASAAADGKVIVWALPEGKALRTLQAPATARTLAFSPDGKTLASAGDDGIVQLWDPNTGQAVRKLEGATDWLLALAFSPDSKVLAAGGCSSRLYAWDTAAGKKLFDVPTQPAPPANTPAPPVNVVAALAYSPDGKTIAVGGSDARIDLMNAADGKPIRPLAGHTGTVTALVFHPSGTVLISASKDRTVRLWNPANGQMLKSLEGHGAWVQGVALFDQGLRLASVSADRTVRVWLLGEPPKKK
jgi:WD40 repeat protein